jgi:hypothetical protein
MATYTAYDGMSISISDTTYFMIGSVVYKITISGTDFVLTKWDEGTMVVDENENLYTGITIESGENITIKSGIMSPFHTLLLVTLINKAGSVLEFDYDYSICVSAGSKFNPTFPPDWQWITSNIQNLNRSYPRNWRDFNDDYKAWVQLVKFAFANFVDFTILPREPAIERYT